jgi:hypothetical protein
LFDTSTFLSETLLKIFFCLLLGALACVNVFAQAEQSPAIGVENISLARDDGNGKPGEIVTRFISTDVPIHCLVELSSTEAVIVRMNLVAAKAGGLKGETNVITASYTTTGSQNQVHFKASPNSAWSVGKYRIDILLGGKIVKSLDFEIEKSVVESTKENKPLPKSALRRGKNARLARKN